MKRGWILIILGMVGFTTIELLLYSGLLLI